MADKLGIIAGGGALPRRLIDACRRSGRDFFVLALRGQAEQVTLQNAPHRWVGLGAVDEAVKILKSEGVKTVVLAGSVRRPSLFEMKPDLRALQVFVKLGMSAFGDDTLLRAVTQELEKDGFSLVGAHEIDPGLLTPEGVLTKKKAPTPAHQADIDYGIRAARALGALDIGQAVVVQQGIVLGVEAVEGTDELLQRCRMLRKKGRGGVLVKLAKPQQDKRLDLPAAGVMTVAKAYEAGLEGIALEAGASLLLDPDSVSAAADRMGLFIVGVRPT